MAFAARRRLPFRATDTERKREMVDEHIGDETDDADLDDIDPTERNKKIQREQSTQHEIQLIKGNPSTACC